MRRDTFIKSLLALTAAAGLPLSARAAASIKMMIPANPGGPPCQTSCRPIMIAGTTHRIDIYDQKFVFN